MCLVDTPAEISIQLFAAAPKEGPVSLSWAPKMAWGLIQTWEGRGPSLEDRRMQSQGKQVGSLLTK